MVADDSVDLESKRKRVLEQLTRLENSCTPGTIDRPVLSRLFKEISGRDTDADLDAVLKSSDCCVNGDREIVCLESFLEYLFGARQQPASSAQKKKAARMRTSLRICEGSISSLDTYMDGLVVDVKGFHEMVSPRAIVQASGDSPEEMAQLKEDLKQKAKDYVLAAQKKNIRPLWDQFDKDGNGVLSPLECRDLVAAYLKSLVPKSDEIVKGSIEIGIELSVALIEKRVKDPKVMEQIRAHSKKQAEVIVKQVAPRVKEMLQKTAAEDPGPIADELLETLDLNKDGQVTRDEFEERFAEAMHHVLGPERMVEKVQSVNAFS